MGSPPPFLPFPVGPPFTCLWLNTEQLIFLKKVVAAVTGFVNVDSTSPMVSLRNTLSDLLLGFTLDSQRLALARHSFKYSNWNERTGSLFIPFNSFQNIMSQASDHDNLLIRLHPNRIDLSFVYFLLEAGTQTAAVRLSLSIVGTRVIHHPFRAWERPSTEAVQISLRWSWLRHVLSVREFDDTVLAALIANPTGSNETRITFTCKGIRFADSTSNTSDLFMSIPYEGAVNVIWGDLSLLEFDLIASQTYLASFLSATSLDDPLQISILHNRTPHSNKVRFQGGTGELIFYFPFTN